MGFKTKNLYSTNRSLVIVHKFFPDVIEIRDGKKALQLSISKRDAKPKGRQNHAHCALAEACNRQLNLDGAIISLSRAYLIKGTIATRYELPPSIGREITSFDRGATFAPGSYTLNKIAHNHKLGTPRGSKYGPKKKKRQAPRHVTSGVRTDLRSIKV